MTAPETADRATVFADLYRKGASLRELAEEYGVAYGTARNWVAKGGATLRGRGGNTRGGKSLRASLSSALEGSA